MPPYLAERSEERRERTGAENGPTYSKGGWPAVVAEAVASLQQKREAPEERGGVSWQSAEAGKPEEAGRQLV